MHRFSQVCQNLRCALYMFTYKISVAVFTCKVHLLTWPFYTSLYITCSVRNRGVHAVSTATARTRSTCASSTSNLLWPQLAAPWPLTCGDGAEPRLPHHPLWPPPQSAGVHQGIHVYACMLTYGSKILKLSRCITKTTNSCLFKQTCVLHNTLLFSL